MSRRFSSRMYNVFRRADGAGERFQTWCAGLRGRSRVLSVLVGLGLLPLGAVLLGRVVLAGVPTVAVLGLVAVLFFGAVFVFGVLCAILVSLVMVLSYLVLPFMCLMSGREAGCGEKYHGGSVR